MKQRHPFTVFPRKQGNGKTYYYYQTYDHNGKRTVPRSTGQATKSAALTFCSKLLKNGELIPNPIILFKEFTKEFFIYDTCEYIQNYITKHGSYSRTYAYILRLHLEKYILPVFGNRKIDSITQYEIEKWLYGLPKLDISNTTANHILKAMKIIMKEAVRREYLTSNPAKNISNLNEQPKEKGILTIEEFQQLFFNNESQLYWKNSLLYAANLLSAVTGMRLGEIRGLQRSNIKENYLLVEHSFNDNDGLKTTKTKKSRIVPIPSELNTLLFELSSPNKEEFVFSYDDGANPLSSATITGSLYKTLERIGITKEIRKKRNITFHSWRHFFNSVMTAHIDPQRVMLVTGHSTLEMSKHYTHISSEHLAPIVNVQKMLISADKQA